MDCRIGHRAHTRHPTSDEDKLILPRACSLKAEIRKNGRTQEPISILLQRAPGFWIHNVIVMAGVPSIMQVMLDEVAPKLKTSVRVLSETVRADAREGDSQPTITFWPTS